MLWQQQWRQLAVRWSTMAALLQDGDLETAPSSLSDPVPSGGGLGEASVALLGADALADGDSYSRSASHAHASPANGGMQQSGGKVGSAEAQKSCISATGCLCTWSQACCTAQIA